MRRTLGEQIDIVTTTGDGTWNCEIDRALLESALVDLAINARDAMPDGGTLTIETANSHVDDDARAETGSRIAPGQYVLIRIMDTGIGMPPSGVERAFEPFFTTKTLGGGSGLSLSRVYGFAKQSGGHITIESQEGQGTIVELYLPRSTDPTVDDPMATAEIIPIARGETILVVEDDPDVRTLLVALLTSLDYRVFKAAAGEAALERLGSIAKADLPLTDVILAGGMNGSDLANRAKHRRPGIKVLFVSGYTEDIIAHHRDPETDKELLQKPFRKTELERVVRKLLDS